MRNESSKLWLLGPPFALLLTAFVYYAKFEGVRQWVDERSPWIKENVGSRLPPLVEKEEPVTSSVRANRAPASPQEVVPEAPTLPPPVPSFIGPDGTLDLARLATSKSSWPKSVKINVAMEFPAVVNGKVVGKLQAPIGTEANLVAIQNGKLGLEYQGGGGWFGVDQTDLIQRMPK